MSDSDEDDYVGLGTPLDGPPPGAPGDRRGAGAGALVVASKLPVWKQTVTDEQGRQRFHGAPGSRPV
jgi:hypothetical protein